MLSCQVIMTALERIAPRHLAEDWDNPGLLVGSFAQKIGRILVALDVDDTVTQEAIERKADMIVAHHPAIFRGVKQLRLSGSVSPPSSHTASPSQRHIRTSMRRMAA